MFKLRSSLAWFYEETFRWGLLDYIAQRFYLATLPEVKQDFVNCWYYFPELKAETLTPRPLF